MRMNEFRLDISLALVIFLRCFALHTSGVENTVGGWAIEENREKRGNTSELFSHFKWLHSKLSHQLRGLWGGMLSIQTTCKCILWNNTQPPSHKHHWDERKGCFFHVVKWLWSQRTCESKEVFSPWPHHCKYVLPCRLALGSIKYKTSEYGSYTQKVQRARCI